MKVLVDKGLHLEYSNIEHKTFKNNLLFLDMCMPNSTSKIKDTVEIVAAQNPFEYTGDVVAFQEHKMKVLPIDAALGMTPAKEQKGHDDANGGYIVIKKDGDIVCYHFYNKNDVEDYLYNTRFDRASRSRYEYGELYRGEDGAVYMKLNLQIRFKK